MKNNTITAQVILFSKDHRIINGKTIITSDTIITFLPDEKTISEFLMIFRKNGFEVGEVIGISFSITGSQDTFEKFLGMQVMVEEDGSCVFVSNENSRYSELKNELLPEVIREGVQSIAFTRPPDFGPKDW